MTIRSPNPASAPLEPAVRLLDSLSAIHDRVAVADVGAHIQWNTRCSGATCQAWSGIIAAGARKLPRLPMAPAEGFDFGVYDVDGGPQAPGLLVAIGKDEAFRPLPDASWRELARVLDHAPDAVMVCNTKGRITYLNSEAKHWLGDGCGELIGAPVTVLLSNLTDLERVLGALCERVPLRDEIFSLRSRGDSLGCASISSGHIDTPVGPQVVLYLRNVGKRLDREIDLSRRHAELEQEVAVLAHDLRSPLSSMRAFATLLGDQFAERLGETGHRFLERIDQAGRRMESLVHDILEASHLDRHGPHRPVQPVDPGPILDQLSQELKLLLDEEGIELVVPDSPPRLYCSETELYRVLSNLIGNAIEHMGSCTQRRIRVEIADEGHRQHLKVEDQGQGMTNGDWERTLEGVRPVDRAQGTRTSRGFGMGLKIVRKIAESHGGRVWVDSSSGRGTTVHVTFAGHR